MQDRISIRRAEGGYILNYKEPGMDETESVYTENELPIMLNNISELLGHTDSKHNSERLFIGKVPTEKYESLICEELERMTNVKIEL